MELVFVVTNTTWLPSGEGHTSIKVTPLSLTMFFGSVDGHAHCTMVERFGVFFAVLLKGNMLLRVEQHKKDATRSKVATCSSGIIVAGLGIVVVGAGAMARGCRLAARLQDPLLLLRQLQSTSTCGPVLGSTGDAASCCTGWDCCCCCCWLLLSLLVVAVGCCCRGS